MASTVTRERPWRGRFLGSTASCVRFVRGIAKCEVTSLPAAGNNLLRIYQKRASKRKGESHDTPGTEEPALSRSPHPAREHAHRLPARRRRRLRLAARGDSRLGGDARVAREQRNPADRD